ncbi:MAG: DUF190 domain-containing protein [Spirochaetia bacterium]|nr:DUF190 domain-containing protein [Spirochaetia bacterium]
MEKRKNAKLLRVYVSETDKIDRKPLYEEIALKAKELKLAGATVFRGIMGFGRHSEIHSAKILSISEKLPMVIEIIDVEENINKLLDFLAENLKEGLAVIDDIKIIEYKR